MIRAVVRSLEDCRRAVRERRRRFGLDAPLPADPFVIERAVLRHISACRPDAVVLKLAREPAPAPNRSGHIDLAAGVPDLLLLLPNGRAAFLAIRTQAQNASRPERAFADLCRTRAVPVHIVRSLPEARQALDRLGLASLPEKTHAVQEDGVARQPASRPARP